jgi:2'-5' RNA ligase
MGRRREQVSWVNVFGGRVRRSTSRLTNVRAVRGHPGALARRFLRRSGDTAVVVPVPAADAAVASWRGERRPVVLAGMRLHITVLYPFVPARRLAPEVERAVGETLAQFSSFDFRLARLGAFPNVLYLAPEPAEPFVELTRTLWQAWPAHPPYRGAFESIVPHVTVGSPSEGQDIDALKTALPIEAHVSEVCLMARRDGRWLLRRRFLLS